MNAQGQQVPTGIRQFVVGTGGAGVASGVTLLKPNSELFVPSTFGVLKLTLQAAGYHWAFIGTDGRIVRYNGQDVAGSGTCP
jgi:hypothetical protein